jgi:hypothetical protein
MTRYVPMSRRVAWLVRRMGGSLPERLVLARLTTAYGRAEAKDGIRRVLERELVWRQYQDGEDCLVIPDDEPEWLPGHGDVETSSVPPDDRFDGEGRGWSL